MGNSEKSEGEIKNGQSRENRRATQEWAIQRKPKGQSRIGNPEKINGQSRKVNPEKTDGAIKNGKSRENRMGNQEWEIQRKPKGQSRMGNPEKTEWAIQRKPMGQSRLGNPEMLARVCTQSTGRTQTKQKTQHRKLKR
jgi:hypothetical protein